MAPRGHTLLLKRTLRERLKLCKELVDTLEKLGEGGRGGGDDRASLARATHQVGLWSGVSTGATVEFRWSIPGLGKGYLPQAN